MGLALALAGDDDELADLLLERYELRGPELELVVNLASLVGFGRDGDRLSEALYNLALWKAAQ